MYVRFFWQGNRQLYRKCKPKVGTGGSLYRQGTCVMFLAGKSPCIYGHVRCLYTVLANPAHLTRILLEGSHSTEEVPAHNWQWHTTRRVGQNHICLQCMFTVYFGRGGRLSKSLNIHFFLCTPMYYHITRAYINFGLKRMTQLAWASVWPRFLAYNTHVFSHHDPTRASFTPKIPPTYFLCVLKS